MNVTSLKKALMAGAAGTVVMTVFTFVSHTMHLPSTDFQGMIADHLPMGGTPFAWVVYFGLGVALAFAYETFFMKKMPLHSWSRGALYGIALWIFTGVVLMPVFGMGFFSGSMTGAAAAMVSMALYGATMGYMYEH